MRSVREWAGSWSYAEILGPEPPLWLGIVMIVPPAMGVIALSEWSDASIGLVVALGTIAIVVARVATDWLMVEPGRALAVIAIHLGIVLAVTGARPSPAIATSTPLVIAALPVLMKVWGMLVFAIDVALTLRRQRATVRSWLAHPDDRGLHVRCQRVVAGGDIRAQVLAPGTPREVTVARKLLPGRGSGILGREYILFDPIVVPEPRAEGYRDVAGERVESMRELGWVTSDNDAMAGELALSALVVVATHAGLLGIAFVLGEVTR